MLMKNVCEWKFAEMWRMNDYFYVQLCVCVCVCFFRDIFVYVW